MKILKRLGLLLLMLATAIFICPAQLISWIVSGKGIDCLTKFMDWVTDKMDE